MTQGPNGVNDNGILISPAPGFVALGQVVVVEFRSTTPHNLKTGQSVGVNNGALTCTLNGTTTVTTASTAALVTGMTAVGANIPVGTTITVNSSTQFTLSNAATGSGSHTVYFPPTIPITTFVLSQCVVTNGSAIVTMPSTAGLTTGNNVIGPNIPANTTITVNSSTQITLSNVATGSNTETLTFPGVSGPYTFFYGAEFEGGNLICYVTGKYTIALVIDTASTYTVARNYVNSTTEIPIFMTASVYQPANMQCIPYQFAASMVSTWPNCDLHLNLSLNGSDGYYQTVAQDVVPHMGTSNNIILEMGNEHFNSATQAPNWAYFHSLIPAYCPPGTPLWTFTEANGASSSFAAATGAPLFNYNYGYAAHAAHGYDVFIKAAVAAGFPRSRIKISYGGWWASPAATNDMGTLISTYNLPADYIDVAMYAQWQNVTSTIAAFSPAGYQGVATAGNWPVWMINDLYRHQVFYSIVNQLTWQQHNGYAQAAGNATTPKQNISMLVYECALENAVLTTGFDYQAINWDALQHTSYYDCQHAFYLAMQVGNPPAGYPGAARANYFSLTDAYPTPYLWGGTSSLWWLMTGISQPPGLGAANQFITPQGGSPGTRSATGYSNQIPTGSGPAANQGVATQAFVDWLNVTTPFYAPTDVSLTPAPGATGISASVVIVAQFNEPMTSSTITTSTFTVKQGSRSISGTVAYNVSTWAATFTPSSKLASPITYTVQLSTGIQNAAGTALAAPITWSFTTSSSTCAPRLWFPGLRAPTPRITL